MAVAFVAVAVPAWRDAAVLSVGSARRTVGRSPTPLVLRMGLDVVLLAASLLVFWLTARGHYSLVLAPEGVPTVSLSYWALAGPLLLWAGAGLLVWRGVDLVLG